MDREAFEARVLALWTGSRLPLTRVNLQLTTGASREKLDRWLDALVKDGVLELDSDDGGNMLWNVVGTERPKKGVSDIAEWQKLEQLKGTVAATASSRPGPLKVRGGATADRKSVLASAGLSFVLGPFGWIYAAPLTDAIAGIAIYMIIHALLPTFLFFWLLGLAQPLSAILGALYAWQYNQKGERTSVRDIGKDDKKPKLLK